MVAIDFPGTPTNGQEVTLAGTTYVFNGTGWTTKAPASGGGGTPVDAYTKAESDALYIDNVVTTVITISGTYTKPPGLKFLEVWSVGGGGGTSDCPPTNVAGTAVATGGGGGAGMAYKRFAAADVAASVALTVGAGGFQPMGVGSVGGHSVFGPDGVGPQGGGGGAAPPPTATAQIGYYYSGGSAGGASGGDLNLIGGDGTYGWANSHGWMGAAVGGDGGTSFFAGRKQAPFAAPGAAYNANNGYAYGGGATGGAIGGGIGFSTGGGTGGNGVIILKEYF